MCVCVHHISSPTLIQLGQYTNFLGDEIARNEFLARAEEYGLESFPLHMLSETFLKRQSPAKAGS